MRNLVVSKWEIDNIRFNIYNKLNKKYISEMMYLCIFILVILKLIFY